MKRDYPPVTSCNDTLGELLRRLTHKASEGLADKSFLFFFGISALLDSYSLGIDRKGRGEKEGMMGWN